MSSTAEDSHTTRAGRPDTQPPSTAYVAGVAAIVATVVGLIIGIYVQGQLGDTATELREQMSQLQTEMQAVSVREGPAGPQGEPGPQTRITPGREDIRATDRSSEERVSQIVLETNVRAERDSPPRWREYPGERRVRGGSR